MHTCLPRQQQGWQHGILKLEKAATSVGGKTAQQLVPEWSRHAPGLLAILRQQPNAINHSRSMQALKYSTDGKLCTEAKQATRRPAEGLALRAHVAM
jgi:hypothetical protein